MKIIEYDGMAFGFRDEVSRRLTPNFKKQMDNWVKAFMSGGVDRREARMRTQIGYNHEHCPSLKLAQDHIKEIYRAAQEVSDELAKSICVDWLQSFPKEPGNVVLLSFHREEPLPEKPDWSLLD